MQFHIGGYDVASDRRKKSGVNPMKEILSLKKY